MPTIADYTIVQDFPFTLPDAPTGDIDRELDFTTPAVEVGQRSILTFKVDPAGDVIYEIKLNDTPIATRRFTEPATVVVLQEVIGSNILSTGNNKLVVTRTDGSGSITVADMVLWFQANI